MTELLWNQALKKQFSNGVEAVALYPQVAGTYPLGVAWEGVMSIAEKPGGDEPTHLYANNVKYGTLTSAPTFEGSIEAYMSPPEFDPCDGTAIGPNGVAISMQTRQEFGMAYKVWINSAGGGQQESYELHLVYGSLAKPTEKTRQTIGENSEATTMSWEFSTTPVGVTGQKATSHLIIKSADVDPAFLTWIEEELYGTVGEDPNLPLPDEILTWSAV